MVDTVSVFYEIDNFLNGDYDLLHDYVIALNVIFGDCDNFFNHKCGYSGMFAVWGHASWNLPAPRDDAGLQVSRGRPKGGYQFQVL